MAQAQGYHDDPGSSFRAPFGAAWLKRGTAKKKERIRRASKIMIRQNELAKSEPNGVKMAIKNASGFEVEMRFYEKDAQMGAKRNPKWSQSHSKRRQKRKRRICKK